MQASRRWPGASVALTPDGRHGSEAFGQRSVTGTLISGIQAERQSLGCALGRSRAQVQVTTTLAGVVRHCRVFYQPREDHWWGEVTERTGFAVRRSHEVVVYEHEVGRRPIDRYC